MKGLSLIHVLLNVYGSTGCLGVLRLAASSSLSEETEYVNVAMERQKTAANVSMDQVLMKRVYQILVLHVSGRIGLHGI